MTSNPQNQSAGSSKIDLLLKVLTTTNAVEPVAAQAVAGLIAIIKGGRATGKSDEEIAAQLADTDATELRTRGKSELQMGDQT